MVILLLVSLVLEYSSRTAEWQRHQSVLNAHCCTWGCTARTASDGNQIVIIIITRVLVFLWVHNIQNVHWSGCDAARFSPRRGRGWQTCASKKPPLEKILRVSFLTFQSLCSSEYDPDEVELLSADGLKYPRTTVHVSYSPWNTYATLYLVMCTTFLVHLRSRTRLWDIYGEHFG